MLILYELAISELKEFHNLTPWITMLIFQSLVFWGLICSLDASLVLLIGLGNRKVAAF